MLLLNQLEKKILCYLLYIIFQGFREIYYLSFWAIIRVLIKIGREGKDADGRNFLNI